VRVIVDTNIFVSGIISKKGAPAKIIETMLAGTLIPVMSEATFAELQEVLHRPRPQTYFQRAGITTWQAKIPEQAPIRPAKVAPATPPDPDLINHPGSYSAALPKFKSSPKFHAKRCPELVLSLPKGLSKGRQAAKKRKTILKINFKNLAPLRLGVG
jgi:hypothetical protein